MDRAHITLALLLNLVSVQLTFCGTGEHVMYLTPSNFDMRSMGVQPFIQAQFHPATGTIQQGIMLPQEHPMPQERIPEELYYQERMMPQGSMVHQERILPPDHVIPHERTVPQDSMQYNERLMSQENMLQERTLPQEPRGNMVPQERMVPQENVQKIIHSNPPHPHTPLKQGEQTTNDLTDAHNRLEEDRAVKGGYEYPHQAYPQTPSYGYSSPPPSYNAPASSGSSYSPTATPYAPPVVHSDSTTKFLAKPDLTELIKPVSGKMAGKLNGLVGLVLSLLSSGKGLELTGIKELLFDGILKPLLAAKGGLKALISKLAIPVVALILINVEVLLTVWWLWEDCPVVKEVEYTKPSYSAPAGASSSYNNYS